MNKDGVETVTVEENGRLISKTVNGQPALEGDMGGQKSAIESGDKFKIKGKRSRFILQTVCVHNGVHIPLSEHHWDRNLSIIS